MSKPPRRYFVYMLSNPVKMLYTGVMGDLFRPV
jgi:predicted GIY-YIG superfamily endonuclease